MKSKTWMLPAFAGLLGLLCPATGYAVVTFESVPLGGANGIAGVWNGQNGSGQLVTDGASFTNSHTAGPGYYYWSGFAASNRTSADPSGAWLDEHQYLSAPGSGAGGSATYGVFYGWGSTTFSTAIDMTGKGMSVTNISYTIDSMSNGDNYAKKFGGATGNDADWFMLTITGSLNGVASANPVEFYLADFRFADNGQDYLVMDWEFVDLSALGTVDSLSFSLSSSDTHPIYGINTPAYFALDNIGAVPEASSLVIAALGSGLMLRRGRRH